MERLSKLRELELANKAGDPGKSEEVLDVSGHPYIKLEPVAKHSKSPLLPDVKPSTSYVDDEIIELSSDDDSDTDCRTVGLFSSVLYPSDFSVSPIKGQLQFFFLAFVPSYCWVCLFSCSGLSPSHSAVPFVSLFSLSAPHFPFIFMNQAS